MSALGCRCEVRFDDLQKDKFGQIQRIYNELSLGTFEDVRGPLKDYTDGLAAYKKNTHKELDPALKAMVATRWKDSFEEFGYEI